MPKKKKKKNKKTPEVQPTIGSFVSAEPNIKPSERKKGGKKKKNNGKDKKSKKKDTKKKETKPKPAKKANKKKKKAIKHSKSAKTDKGKKNKAKKDKKKGKGKKSKSDKASKKNSKPKDKSHLFLNLDDEGEPKENKETESFKEELQKQEKTASKKGSAAFPWSNWAIDRDGDEQKTHNTRRSSLGSIRELHIQHAKKSGGGHRKKKGGGHRKHKSVKKKKQKKDKKEKDKHNIENSIKDVDIYDPDSKKKMRRKEKKKEKFKVVPKHHIKRSSLPTYQSVKKNNPHLRFLVKKETDRNLATLLDQPEKRKKSKELKNLSRGGFVIHVNHRYRLEDGRLGVCKYRGRTQFGKSSEDWIGLVIQVGTGEHDGTVQGKTYFRCRDGKGIFVRPYDVIQDMGSQNKMLSKQDIKLAEANIKRYKKLHEKGTTTSADVIQKDKHGNAINPDHGYDMMNEKFFNPKTLLDKNKGKRAAKKKHHTQV